MKSITTTFTPPKGSASATAGGHEYFWLSVSDDGRIFLLGYPLDLTGREHDILLSITGRYPLVAGIDEICSDCDGLNPGNIPVHINAINKKAALISGRRLIVAQRKVGYTLNPFM